MRYAICQGRVGVAFGLAALAQAASAGAGAPFWDQQHDFVGYLPSEHGTTIGSARTADDFIFNAVLFLTSIEVEMIVSFPNSPSTFRVDVLAEESGQPGDVVLAFDNPLITDLGPWNGDPDLHHLLVVFDTGVTRLDDGFYWLSPYAVGNGSGTDRAFWGTSEFGNPTREQGMFRSGELGFPDWTGVSHPDLLGEESGFAFKLTGTLPAPGGLAALIMFALGSARRRARD